jgi:2-phospho-L-lactate guanylyltransferase
MSGTIWAVVPVKSLGHVKQRLAPALPQSARYRLMLIMFEDVMAVLQELDEIDTVLVVTPDAYVAQIAGSLGAEVLKETERRGHSAAVAAGFAEARAGGAAHAVTLPADAPLITAQEVRALLAQAPATDTLGLTIVPNREGEGTNAILATPPDAFEPSFGPGSLLRHQALALDCGIPCNVIDLPGIAMDVDDPGDLMRLMAAKRNDPRYAFLDAHSANTFKATVESP